MNFSPSDIVKVTGFWQTDTDEILSDSLEIPFCYLEDFDSVDEYADHAIRPYGATAIDHTTVTAV